MEISPLKQTGHNCKITAIAMVEQYFSHQLQLQPIPLHKRKSAQMSIRQISKLVGSLQGELLQVNQLIEIFSLIGYHAELVDVSDNFESFKNTIEQNINKESLIIAAFAVDSDTRLPGDYNGYNEHAAVVHGYDQGSCHLDMMHWSSHVQTKLSEFYQSSMQLPTHRLPEYYVNIKSSNLEKKYDLCVYQSEDYFLRHRSLVAKSITPEANSGFRGKLIVVKKPQKEVVLQARKDLTPMLLKRKVVSYLDDIQHKIHELLDNKDASYLKVHEQANLLNLELIQVKKQYLESKLTLAQFKLEIDKLVQKAMPEFANHRGWHQFHVALRCFLGFLFGLTIIPALIVSACARKGYQGTFFETPKTDSATKLEQFHKHISALN